MKPTHWRCLIRVFSVAIIGGLLVSQAYLYQARDSADMHGSKVSPLSRAFSKLNKRPFGKD